MEKIKILIIEDAGFIRKLIADTINAEPGMNGVSITPNGDLGLQKIPLYRRSGH